MSTPKLKTVATATAGTGSVIGCWTVFVHLMPALQLLIVAGPITAALIIVVVCALRDLRRSATDHGGRLHVLQLLELVLSRLRSRSR
jgi:hypothetical protein